MTESPIDRPVVVGVRDQQPGLLDFACGMAATLGCTLRVVHAYVAPFPHAYAAVVTEQDPDSALLPASRQVISDARSHLAAASDDVDVEYELAYGYPPAVLGAQSYGAKALVIGTDDVGWFDRVAGAAVTNFLSVHAACPVVVVPPGVTGFEVKEVIVALDGESAATGPLQFAFELADKANTDVRALHVVRAGDGEIESVRALLAEVLAGWTEIYPTVTVSSEVLVGRPSREILSASDLGSLIVVGQPHGDTLGGWRSPVARSMVRAGERAVAAVPAGYMP